MNKAVGIWSLWALAFALTSCSPGPKYDRPPRPDVTAEEAVAPQQVAGKLCQSAIGFALDDPGPAFHERTELRSGEGNLRAWVWESDETHERLVITVVKAMGELPEGFKQFAAGSRSGMAKVAKIEEENVDIESRPYVSNLNARLENGNAYSTRCIGTGAEHGMPWTICAATVALEHASLQPLRESLSVGSCK